MSTDDRESAFLAALRAELERSVHELDASTATRLRAMRATALAAKQRRYSWWLPAGGFVAASIAVAVVVLLNGTPPEAGPMAGLEYLEMFSGDENLELYTNLDFYRWLAAQSDAG